MTTFANLLIATLFAAFFMFAACGGEDDAPASSMPAGAGTLTVARLDLATRSI